MAIEVRELVIKATVEPQAGGMPAAGTASPADNSVSPEEELVKRCVEKVLEILRERDGR